MPCAQNLGTCWIEGVILNSLTLKIMPIFWHISPLEISASACFGLSHFILIKGRSLHGRSTTPLKTKTFPFLASAEWYDLGSDTLTFFLKTCSILGQLCTMAKPLGVSPMKIQPFFVWLICKTLRFGWYCLSSLMILICVLNFGSIPVAMSGVLFL